MSTHVGQLQTNYSSRGRITFQIELWHEGLNKHRVIKGPETPVVQRKAILQAQDWDERWQRTLDAAEMCEMQGSRKQTAIDQTEAAEMELGRLEKILQETLGVDDSVDWEQLKDTGVFPVALPEPAPPKNLLPKPKSDDPIYAPKLGLLDRVISSRRERVLADSTARFDADSQAWLNHSEKINQENAVASSRHAQDLCDWETKRSEFVQMQSLQNEAVERQRQAYETGSPDAILEHADLVLSSSIYPDYFPQEFELDYIDARKISGCR